jgi:calcium permeable stress-gated cation channel
MDLNDSEALTSARRDASVNEAFQNIALRTPTPILWLPKDELGVSDYEKKLMRRNGILVSNKKQNLDSAGRCVYQGAPPDVAGVRVSQS